MQTGCVWLQPSVDGDTTGGVDERNVKPVAARPVTTMLFSVFLPVFFTVTGNATGFPTVATTGDDVATVAVML